MVASPQTVKWFVGAPPSLARSAGHVAGVAAAHFNRYWSRMIPRFLFALFVASAVPVFAAEPKGDTFTDPTNAGPDYALQGEYADEKTGAQVIALGDGKFHIVGWLGGLPGASNEIEKKVEGDAARGGDAKAAFQSEGWKGWLDGKTLVGTNDEGRTWTLTKVHRTSPTAGAKAPPGAVVLFDGTNADGWENGKVDANGWLNCGVKSKRKFGDMTLHVEFRTPFQPAARGQGRGNSGVYLQDRYECQVLDSFGLKGENNECGGIYTIAKPRVNMCFPPLEWQTFDIDFTAAKFDAAGNKTRNAIVTVKHNGVLIHDRVEIPKPTGGGAKETVEPGPIQLQNHGNPVVYRNIWVVEKK
jgi:hypothetical protein